MAKPYIRPGARVLVVAAVLLLSGKAAYAHKLKLFASAEGKKISGYAYLSGGARARNVTVQVRRADGKKLADVKADEKGEFSFEAACRCDHVLTVETADGHRAEFTMRADELPDSLPAPSGGAGAPSSPARKAAVSPPKQGGHAASDIEALVDKAVSRQIAPLRRQIDAYEGKTRLHDILGGIGYILGIAGVAFYFLATRKKGSA